MTKNKTTIDDLAAMILRGFTEMAKQAEVDRGFDAVDDRL